MVDLLALLGGLAVGVLVAIALASAFGRAPVRVAGPAPAPTPPAAPGSAPSPDQPPPAIRVNHPGVTRTAAAGPAAAASPPPGTAPAAGPLRGRLTMSDGADSVELGAEVVTMGRGTDQHLRIPDSRASRAHAIVRPRTKGGWEVKDVGSANGTLLNGHAIPEGRVAPLQQGDRIGIGPVTITYTEISGTPAPGDHPPPGPDATEIL